MRNEFALYCSFIDTLVKRFEINISYLKCFQKIFFCRILQHLYLTLIVELLSVNAFFVRVQRYFVVEDINVCLNLTKDLGRSLHLNK